MNTSNLALTNFDSSSISSRVSIYSSSPGTTDSNSQPTYMGTPVNPSPTMSSCHLPINQSMSGTDHESVFALCLPDIQQNQQLPPVTRLQHIQSQTPRTPKSCVSSVDMDNTSHMTNNNFTKQSNNSHNNNEVPTERSRALSATEATVHLSLSPITNNISFKLYDIVSPSIKTINEANSSSILPILSLKCTENSISTNRIIHSMNNSINNNTNKRENRKYHHSRETTPIHELTKSSMDILTHELSSSMNNIDMLCALLENEEKDAMEAIYAECDDAENSRCNDTDIEVPVDNNNSSTNSNNVNDDTADDSGDIILHLQTENDFLLEHGYEKIAILTTTLQGCVFKARNLNLMSNVDDLPMQRDYSADGFVKRNKENTKNADVMLSSMATVVIKRTNKELHSHGITIQDGKQYSVEEDIVKEMKLMKYFQSLSPPSALIRYLDFFESSTNYYLVMEDGGVDCFDFAVEAHAYIADGRLKIKEWRKFCKFLFWQMTLFIKWLHTEVKCCHLDISLENLLLQDAKFVPKKKRSNELTLNQHIQIKFCDFGLAEFFDANDVGDFRCTKYCGKVNYKAPQVYHKQGIFDARKADIWSLGIVFFSMVIGAPPYIKPIIGRLDDTYDYVERGCIAQLLYDWERNDYVTLRMLSLLNGMLTVNENDRFCILDIFDHPWLRLYKEQYTNHRQMTDMSQEYQIRHRSKSSGGKRGRRKNREVKNGIPVYKLKFAALYQSR